MVSSEGMANSTYANKSLADIARMMETRLEFWRTEDGTSLDVGWESHLPIRWVLDERHQPHCEVCQRYGGEYPGFSQMQKTLGGSMPGRFPNRDRGIAINVYPIPTWEPGSCGEKCTCWLEVKVDGEWKRLLRR